MIIKHPQTLQDIILEFFSTIFLSICNYFGIKLPTASEVDDIFLLKTFFFVFLFLFCLILLTYLYKLTKKLLKKLAIYMSDKIILKEILLIYAFIDDITKQIFYGMFLMFCTFLGYAISYFLQLVTIVNFTYYVLGLEDLVMIFIYRI